MRKLILMLALCGSTFAQTIVLTEAFADPAGQLHFAVTKVLRVEGNWRKNPLDVGTILNPPTARRAHPLRRFGETVLFVLPQADNLRAYWSYNVHDGFVPGLQGRPLSEIVSVLVPPNAPPANPAPTIAAVPPLSRPSRWDFDARDSEEQTQSGEATHQRIIDALKAQGSLAGPSDRK
jgi:hypothetical protein